MKNIDTVKWLIISLFVITFIIPMVLLITKCSFTIYCFIEFLKEFSIPAWVLLFSGSWLYYKKVIKDNDHLRYSDIGENEPLIVVEEIKKRNASLTPRINQRENAERSIKTLEFAIAIAGIIIGLLGVVSFLCKSFIATADN